MKETTFAQQSEKYYADAQNYVVKLQTSPQVIRYQTSFTDYLGKQIEKYQFVGEKILKQVRKKFIAFEHSAEMGEDLKWFSKQVSTFLTGEFFLKYSVCCFRISPTLSLLWKAEASFAISFSMSLTYFIKVSSSSLNSTFIM